MRILHIITSLKIGGAERSLCTLIQSLSQRGFQHQVAYFYDGPCNDVLRKLNIATYQIGGLFSRYDPLAYIRLKKLVQAVKPDLIHTSLWSASILGRLVGFELSIPVVSDLHSNCSQEGKTRNLLDRVTAGIPFRTIAVADEVKKAYQQHVVDTGPRLTVIKNGIDPESVRTQALTDPFVRADYGIEQDAFVIGSVGRLEAIKSYDVLIRAFVYLKKQGNVARKPILLLVGDGSQAAYLKKLAVDLGVGSDVIFTGARTDAYRFYPLFDCFALSSQSEGLSLALLEALCFDLPIVTTNKLTTHEVIQDGVNGFVVPPNDPARLGQAIGQLCNNYESVQAMRAANHQLIRDRFHVNATIDQYENIFRAALKSSD